MGFTSAGRKNVYYLRAHLPTGTKPYMLAASTMKQKYLVILLLFISRISISQILYPNQVLNFATLPSFKHKGDIDRAFRWNDESAENYVIYCETKMYKSHPEMKDSIEGYLNGVPIYNSEFDEKTQEIFIYYFRSGKDSIETVWRINDLVKDCEFDIRTNLVDSALTITDLNNNRVPEIWIIYKKTCSSDVSPLEMKLIMYEGKKKYAIRGETRSETERNFSLKDSPKVIDDAFMKGDKRFLAYANSLWKKHNFLSLR